MHKVILALTAGILGVGAVWMVRPPTSGNVPQQTLDSVWIKLAPGQGFGPAAVFACSPAGVWGMAVIRYPESMSPGATMETVWGVGEQISFEHPEQICDCSAGFNELGPCRQGRWTPTQQEP